MAFSALRKDAGPVPTQQQHLLDRPVPKVRGTGRPALPPGQGVASRCPASVSRGAGPGTAAPGATAPGCARRPPTGPGHASGRAGARPSTRRSRPAPRPTVPPARPGPAPAPAPARPRTPAPRRPPQGRGTVSLSAVAYLLSEVVSYHRGRTRSVPELEERLAALGHPVGARLLELVAFRERRGARELRVLGALQLVHSHLWGAMFGRKADSIEKGNDADNEYMVSDASLALTKFMSVPRDLGHFTPAAFMAGVVRGFLDAAGFPAAVTAHLVPVDGQPKPRTTLLIAFSEEVMRREAALGGP